ncbi:peptidase M24 [Corynebacterium sphenisci DSM 44792]|uniref:Peptidase M24 n=1 Tax=Corynebacterium sphenisci DSM 44792 TaxID=1437874 RepID=A0A1L7CY90_9CORY|nr:Xaa-Pro peptidase family protein [Corynebacterium sphenisci]APT90794.1 peptidase M24 [Corynebacterium sphenisci DSM 44792]
MTESSTVTRFDPRVHATRLTRAADLAAERDLAGLVFGTGPDLQYLIGSAVSSHERLTALVFDDRGRATLVLPAVERGSLADCAVGEVDCAVRLWEDGEDPHLIVADLLDIAAGSRLGVGAGLTADHLLPILEATGAAPVLAGEVLRELFMRKDDAELAQLTAAGAAIDRVHARVPAMLRPGRTEAEVGEEIAAAIVEEGHSAVDFVIVGSGPNGANPHHDVSDRVLAAGDVVVVDIGGTWGAGYHSDCTRTYVLGANAEAEAVYAVLRRAQEAAVAAVRPGVTAAEIDAVARGAIAGAGYGEAFIHRTGHGIGLSLHEEPFIMAGNDLVLEEGMCFSVEPGIYLADRFGMRLEDIVAVTADGARTLNNGDRALVAAGAGEH